MTSCNNLGWSHFILQISWFFCSYCIVVVLVLPVVVGVCVCMLEPVAADRATKSVSDIVLWLERHACIASGLSLLVAVVATSHAACVSCNTAHGCRPGSLKPVGLVVLAGCSCCLFGVTCLVVGGRS